MKFFLNANTGILLAHSSGAMQSCSAYLWAVVVLVAGCTTNPQPLPIPAPPNAAMVFMSLTSAARGTSEVAGLPGSVGADASEIVVQNPSRDIEVRTPIFTDGSFLIDVAWGQHELLLMWAEREGTTSDRVAVPLPPAGKAQGQALVNVSPPAGGTVTVSGTAEPGQRVVVGNKSRGSASSGLAQADGVFSAAIGGAIGDRLVVFAVDPATMVSTTPTEVTVPGP